MIKGFKEFILRGNVIDLAVAVVIGAAFTAIVTAIVQGLINPLIGFLFQVGDLSDFNVSVPTLSGGVSTFEFGSIVVVAGNIPGRTLTAPVYLYQQVEAGDVRAASAISVVLLALSFSLMLGVDRIQRRRSKGSR